MRALAIIIGIGLIGIGLAVGGWLALSVGATPGKAKSSVTAVNVTGFDYSTASLSERRLWLTEQAKPMALMFCLLYTSPSPRDGLLSRMPSSA